MKKEQLKFHIPLSLFKFLIAYLLKVTKEKVTKSQLNPINFSAPLIVARQKCK